MRQQLYGVVIELMDRIISDVEDRVSAKQDQLDQAAAAVAFHVGPLATAHKLAEMTKKYYELANKKGNDS